MRTFVFFIVLCSTVPVPLEAEPWGIEGEWEIFQKEGPSLITCYARRVFQDGSEVQIGFDPSQEGGFFAVYNAAWTHIIEGEKGIVQFDFGTEKFAGDAFGKYLDGVPGGYVFFNNPAFSEAFARRNTVQVSGSNGAIFEMNLSGTSKAVSAVRKCQEAQTEQSTKP